MRFAQIFLVITMALTVVGEAATQSQIETCTEIKGTLAVVEPQDFVVSELYRAGLDSPTSLIRQYAQASNCFAVVERGLASQNLEQERQLASSGMLQSGSNVGQGQMVAADFVMTPFITINDSNSKGAALGMFGGRRLGALGGGVKVSEAQTTLTLSDVRTSLQIASASGKSKERNFALGGGLGGAAGGAYTSTDQGKVVAAAYLDNMNKIIFQIRDRESIVPEVPTAQSNNAANSVQASFFQTGDLLLARLNNVKIQAAPDVTSQILFTVGKGEELIFAGEQQGDFVFVLCDEGEGWVKSLYLTQA